MTPTKHTPQFAFTAITFLDYWTSLTAHEQSEWLRSKRERGHDKTDSNYKVAMANKKQGVRS